MARLPFDATVRPRLIEALAADFEPCSTPRRISSFPLLGVCLRAGLRCKTVPQEFWSAERDDDGHALALIRCPCGDAPVAELGEWPTQCECQRSFFYTGAEVLALNSPAAE
jgi:hypothetical protein